MSASISPPKAERVNSGGRPPHPAHVAAEALVEALAAIEGDREALLRIIHTQNQLCTLAADRVSRLGGIVLPEIRAGYEAAEQLVEKLRETARA